MQLLHWRRFLSSLKKGFQIACCGAAVCTTAIVVPANGEAIDPETDMREWSSTAGTTTRGVFVEYDADSREVLLLIPKRIPLHKLSIDSQGLVWELHAAASEKGKREVEPETPDITAERSRSHAGRSGDSSRKPTKPREWYSGGTLHSKTMLDWQSADSHDKTATCADFIMKMWQDEKLTKGVESKLTEIDDLKPFAAELVEFLDAASKPDTSPETNRRLYANQTVASFAVIGMIQMGWMR